MNNIKKITIALISILIIIPLMGIGYIYPAGMGNSSNRDGPACILVLPAQGSEIFWWDDR